MKKLIISILIAGMLIFGMSMGVMAEIPGTDDSTVVINIDEIAVVEAENTTTAFTFADPATIGDAPAEVTNTESSLKYTSIIVEGETRDITASIGALVPGCELRLILTDGIGVVEGGDGNLGTAASEVTLAVETESDIVTGIGSCNTGTAPEGLTYTLNITDIAAVVSGSQDATVTFTITAGAGGV